MEETGARDMNLVASMAALAFLSVVADPASADEGLPPCIPLNERLSICTNVEGLGVSFIDATPTAAMGIARLQGHEGLLFIWTADWAVDDSLDDYAQTQTRSFIENLPGYHLQKPNTVVFEGYRGIRYDVLPDKENTQGLFPQSILFLDTGGGYAILNGSAQAPDISIDEIHLGARSVAKILRISE